MPNPNIAELGKEPYGRPKGSKNKSTIARENARKLYEEKLAEHFATISDVQFTEAKKKANVKERIYTVDQMIGKPTETKKIELDIELELDV